MKRQADHIPIYSAEVENTWGFTATPPTSSLRGAYAQGQLTFNMNLVSQRATNHVHKADLW
jgi:hypothetical protein